MNAPNDSTPAERRAFNFGPLMRRLANTHCGGVLPAAHLRFSNPDRLTQHDADVKAISPGHRLAYVHAITQADERPQDLDLNR